MIRALFYQDRSGRLTGFTVQGHAEYADTGQDIICAAVSALTLNCINSLERYSRDGFQADVGEDGYVVCRMSRWKSLRTQLLLRSLVLGLANIRKEYGHQYLSIRRMKEV